jgi:TP901 family phage tail tape measure protein
MQLVTQANLPRKSLQGLTKDVQALATTVGQTPTSLAGGLFQIVSSGVHNTARAMQLLKTTGIMASVGGDTVQSSADSLMSIYNSHIPGARNSSQIAAYIEAAIGQGKFHMEDINQSITSGILPMAKRMGMGIPDLFASMAALAREGVPPTQFMSRMRLTLSSVSAPTAAGLKAFHQLHLAPGQLAGDLSRPGHLLTMLDDLQTHAARLKGGPRGLLANALIAQIFGKSRGMGNIAGLLDTLPQMQSIYGNVTGATPALLASHFAETRGTSAFKLQQVRAEFQKSMITLGDSVNKYLVPDLTKLVMWVGKIVQGFGHLSPGLQHFIVILGGAIVLLSPFLIILGGVLRAIGAIGGAFKWLAIKTGILSGAEETAAGATGLGGFARGLATSVPLLLAFGAAMAAIPSVVKAVKNQVHLDKNAIQNKPGARSKLLQHTMSTMSHGGHFGQVDARSVPGKVWHLLTGLFGGAATGGVMTSAGMKVVGERGPELLSLPRGASVTPLPGNSLADIRTSFGEGVGDVHITVNSVLDSKVLATTVATVNRKQQNRK